MKEKLIELCRWWEFKRFDDDLKLAFRKNVAEPFFTREGLNLQSIDFNYEAESRTKEMIFKWGDSDSGITTSKVTITEEPVTVC